MLFLSLPFLPSLLILTSPLQHVFLMDNPWNCDCHLKQFRWDNHILLLDSGLTTLLSETSSSRGASPPPPSPATSRSGWRTRPGPSWTPRSSPASRSAGAGVAWSVATPGGTSVCSAQSRAAPARPWGGSGQAGSSPTCQLLLSPTCQNWNTSFCTAPLSQEWSRPTLR